MAKPTFKAVNTLTQSIRKNASQSQAEKTELLLYYVSKHSAPTVSKDDAGNTLYAYPDDSAFTATAQANGKIRFTKAKDDDGKSLAMSPDARPMLSQSAKSWLNAKTGGTNTEDGKIDVFGAYSDMDFRRAWDFIKGFGIAEKLADDFWGFAVDVGKCLSEIRKHSKQGKTFWDDMKAKPVSGGGGGSDKVVNVSAGGKPIAYTKKGSMTATAKAEFEKAVKDAIEKVLKAQAQKALKTRGDMNSATVYKCSFSIRVSSEVVLS
jgi:hypothetical protein